MSGWENTSLSPCQRAAMSIRGEWTIKANSVSIQMCHILSNLWLYQALKAPFQKLFSELTAVLSTVLCWLRTTSFIPGAQINSSSSAASYNNSRLRMEGTTHLNLVKSRPLRVPNHLKLPAAPTTMYAWATACPRSRSLKPMRKTVLSKF